jgi:hexulose-6-phosphate isomerase
VSRDAGHGIGRRAFVAATLGGVAGAAGLARAGLQPTGRAGTAGTPSPEPAARPRWIRKALKIGMIGVGDTLEAKLAAARRAGFEGVELDSPGPYSHAEIRDAMDATGVVVPGVVLSTHWSKPFNHPESGVRADAAEALETAMRDCHAAGGSTVLVVPAVVNEQMDYAAAYRLSQEAMRVAAPLADELGVRIAFENVWNNFLLSPLEAARYCDELNEGRGRQTFGWYFDIGNIVNYGWPEQWIRTLGDRIVRLDVKEFSRRKRDDEGLWKGFSVEIGEGDVGWERVVVSLKEIGYTGWAAAEVGGGGAERLADIARRMDSVFQQA